MLLYSDIIKEDDQRLRQRSVDVALPLSNEDIILLNDLNEYLENGYDEEIVQKYNLRPGVGIAAVQIGVLKKIFVLYAYDEEGTLYNFGVINPKIISESTEQIYLGTGEGCLSIDRETEGFVHRAKRVVAKFTLYDFETETTHDVQMKFENYIAIVFQHEYDHLNGVLYIDKINKTNPFFVPENSSPLLFSNSEEYEEEWK